MNRGHLIVNFRSFAFRRKMFNYLLMTPAVLVVFAVILYPLIVDLWISFFEVKIFTGFQALERMDPSLNNYRRMFQSTQFWNSVRTTVSYVVLSTSLSALIGLITALLLNQPLRGRGIARALMIAPWPIPGVVAASIFAWMFDANFGVVNYILRTTGLISSNIAWIASPTTALIMVVLATVWKGYPFFTVSLLAGLQSIPSELYEAARIDGGSSLQLFRFITLPALKPVLGISMIISSLWSFRQFEIIYILTRGGPARSTETLSIQVYQEAFRFFEMGYGATVGIFTLALSVLTTVLLFRFVAGRFY